MKSDLLQSPCPCGLGKFTRGDLARVHNDPPGILRCTFCRIPAERYYYPALEVLKRKKKYGKDTVQVH